MERGELTCSVWIAHRLAEGLGVGLDTLLARVSEPATPAELRLAEATRAVPAVHAERAAQLLAIAFGTEPPELRTYPNRDRKRR